MVNLEVMNLKVLRYDISFSNLSMIPEVADRRFWHFCVQIGVWESIGVGFIQIGVDPEKSIF